MKTNRRTVTPLVAAAVASVLGVAACSGQSDKAGGVRTPKPTVLTLVSALDPIIVDQFAAEVTRRSQGTIRVDHQGRWHEGDINAERDLIRHVQAGKASLGVVPARAWHDVGVRSFDALLAPMAVDSLTLEQKVLESDLVGSMLAGTSSLGLTGVGLLPGPMRKPVGTSRQLLGPRDYRGAAIGISSSPIAARTFEVMGAKPTASGFSGARIDRFDGIEQQVSSVAGNQYDGVARSVTANVNLWPRPQVVFANGDAFGALTPTQRETLKAAAHSALPAEISNIRADEKESVGNLCRRGKIQFITASQRQIDQLRKAVEPVYTWLGEDQQTRAAIDAIRSLRTGTESAPADEAPSCPATNTGAAIAGVKTQLDGVYQVTTTVADLLATGVPPSDAVAENYGTWTYVFDRGRFAFTQENTAKGACTWGYGTMAVKGDQMEWTFSGGGGIAPSRATNKAGEHFVFGWSLYRNTLTLTGGPENFRARPWHRVSETPSAGYLSKRCPPPAEALQR